MDGSELLRLSRIEATGLFGIYNHSIELNLDDRATLLHGPNGVGKTAILRGVNALLHDHLEYFRSIPFSHFLIEFHDNTTLRLDANANKGDRTYKLILKGPRNNESSKIDWSTRAASLAERSEYLRPHGSIPATWIDIRDSEVLSDVEVLDRYSHRYISEQKPSNPKDTAWYTLFLKHANAHLIEAQRLVQFNWRPRTRFEYSLDRHTPSMISTVTDCSTDFQRRMGDTMADYGRQSQALDQSFPQRLISGTEEFTMENLQEKMIALDKITEDLKAMGILDETPSHPFNVDSLANIDPTKVRVMTLYVSDTATKLKALDHFANRTRVFLDNVNKKYRNKQIQLDRQSGFIAESDSGSTLPLESLSSGEQQELVLNYDLLFRVPSNTIVLIDEPELSLHVAWQNRFLPDLLKIVELSNFDALVATHSPFIVGDKTHLMVALGEDR